MANSPAPCSATSDGVKSTGVPWRRATDGRFVWVTPSSSLAEVMELERLFPDIIQVQVQSLENKVSAWGHLAILAQSFSRWVPSEVIVREFHRAGVLGEVEAITLAHRHYIFRFSDSKAKDLVLGRPWVANDQLISMVKWQPEFIPEADSLLKALLWIRLPQLLMEFWTEKILSSIISVVVFQMILPKRGNGGVSPAPVFVSTWVNPSGQGRGLEGIEPPSGNSSHMRTLKKFVIPVDPCTSPVPTIHCRIRFPLRSASDLNHGWPLSDDGCPPRIRL